MATKIFIVQGSTGEYSDRYDWAVAAYYDEALAKEHVRKADEYAKALFATRESRYSVDKGVNPYDPEMSMDYTGTSYSYYSVDIMTKLPLVN